MDNEESSLLHDLAVCEREFPGKGSALWEYLGPFHKWSPCLKPVMPDLEQKCRTALFWGEFKRLVVIGRSQLVPYRYNLKHRLGYWIELNARQWLSWVDLERQGKQLSKIERFLSSWRCQEIFRETLHRHTFETITEFLLYPCGLVLGGKLETAKRFKPLIRLWREEGNYPLGLDAHGNLVALVAG